MNQQVNFVHDFGTKINLENSINSWLTRLS